jgi:hypothetical protein
LRDTVGEWFYWAFRVSGAQGKTLTFDFGEKERVGYFGPAVSHDLENWKFAGEKTRLSGGSFIYSFGENENCVYFAHSLLYHPNRFNALKLNKKPFAVTPGGNSVNIYETGTGDKYILLTARHHCCESTGSYVLEGAVREFCENPVNGFTVAAVPFVDIDGVINGDQGKNRYPHDHNRDYCDEPVYPVCAELMRFGMEKDVAAALDFHSPGHIGGIDDKCFLVRAANDDSGAYSRFGKFLREETQKSLGCLKFSPEDDYPMDFGWNVDGPVFAKYFAKLPSVKLSATMETPYFGSYETPVSEESMILYGRRVAKALKKFLIK